MNISKNVKYALIGGAAVILAAVSYHYLSQKASETNEADIDEDLDKLGPLKRDTNEMIDFDYFIKIFQISSFYAKTQFSKKKKEFVAQRRQASRDNDDKKYEEIVF